MVKSKYPMLEARLLAPELQQPLEEYFASRRITRGTPDQSFPQVLSLADQDAFPSNDFAMEFALSVIYLRLLDGNIAPAVLLFEIVDIAQFGIEYFQDERTLNEVVASIRGYLEVADLTPLNTISQG